MSKILRHYDFLRQFPRQEKAPVYFIYGADAYLKDKVMNAILTRYRSEGSEDFDFNILYGDSVKEVEIREQLEIMPIIAEYRIVVIRNFELIQFKTPDKFCDYLKHPSQALILIIISEKYDKRKKIYKCLDRTAVTIECHVPYRSEDIIKWLKSEIRRRKIRMDPEAVATFANIVDKDYLTALNELEKLIIFSTGSSVINRQDVLAAVGKLRANSIFDLQKALGRKDLKSSMQILENMIENSDSPVYINTMLTRFFMSIWKVLSCQRHKIPEKEIISTYLSDVFRSYRREYIEFAAFYDLQSIRKVFDLLLQADIDLKSIDIQKQIILEQLIYRICKL